MKRTLSALLLLIPLALAGCDRADGIMAERIDGVERILQNSSDEYTFFVGKETELVMHHAYIKPIENGFDADCSKIDCAHQGVTFFQDVPADQKMWVLVRALQWNSRPRSADMHYCYGLEFHIHSVQDINGGGWDHGKFGRGMTTPIE